MASRVAFAAVIATGEAPTVTEPDSKAADELRALVDELETMTYAQTTAVIPAE